MNTSEQIAALRAQMNDLRNEPMATARIARQLRELRGHGNLLESDPLTPYNTPATSSAQPIEATIADQCALDAVRAEMATTTDARYLGELGRKARVLRGHGALWLGPEPLRRHPGAKD